jgi:hypothetical protein
MAIATAAQDMKLQVLSLDAQNPHELERALAEAKQSGADAAVSSPFVTSLRGSARTD